MCCYHCRLAWPHFSLQVIACSFCLQLCAGDRCYLIIITNTTNVTNITNTITIAITITITITASDFIRDVST